MEIESMEEHATFRSKEFCFYSMSEFLQAIFKVVIAFLEQKLGRILHQ